MPSNQLEARRGALAGYTLVETLIAVVLLAVGLLALASTTAFTVKLMTAARTSTRTAIVAWSALETIAQQACRSGTGTGEREMGGMAVSWSIAVTGALAGIEVLVEPSGPNGVTAYRLETGRVCVS